MEGAVPQRHERARVPVAARWQQCLGGTPRWRASPARGDQLSAGLAPSTSSVCSCINSAATGEDAGTCDPGRRRVARAGLAIGI